VKAEGHEEESCRLATQYLAELGFNSDELNQVKGMIRATKIPQKPLNRLEEILADADLDYLGRPDFDAISMTLFEELKIRGIVHDLEKWDQIQLTFWVNISILPVLPKRSEVNIKCNILNELKNEI